MIAFAVKKMEKRLVDIFIWQYTLSCGVKGQDTPRLSSQHKGHLFAPESQRAWNKRQRQEIEGEGKEEMNKGEKWDRGQRTASG